MKLEELPEYLQDTIATIKSKWSFEKGNFNRFDLIVFKEKHGNRYFRLASKEDLSGAALTILKERLKNIYIYKSKGPVELDFTIDDVENMPPSLKESAMSKLKDYNRRISEAEKDNEDYYLSQYAIENNDGEIAWYVLMCRVDYEYEGYSLQKFESYE
jgi:hypothetical protein